MGLKVIGHVVNGHIKGVVEPVPVLFNKDEGNNDNGYVFLKDYNFHHEIGDLGVYANVEVFMVYAEKAGWFERA